MVAIDELAGFYAKDLRAPPAKAEQAKDSGQSELPELRQQPDRGFGAAIPGWKHDRVTTMAMRANADVARDQA